jgi:hypothetical protein
LEKDFNEFKNNIPPKFEELHSKITNINVEITKLQD